MSDVAVYSISARSPCEARKLIVDGPGIGTVRRKLPRVMVSDERRLQLNREFFSKQVESQQNAYTSSSPTPQERLWRARAASAEATLGALLAPGASVLDVGCGTGTVAGALSAAGFEVTAVDLIDAMIGCGRQADSSVNWLHSPFSDKIAPKASFDAVVALGFLEYQERAGKELVRMARLLKPGGYLVLSVPNTLSSQFRFGLTRALFRAAKEPEQIRVRHSFTPERLQRLLGMAGYILMDYQWLDQDSPPLALGATRERAFWEHRVKERLKPEMLTLSRTYTSADTAFSGGQI